MFFFVCFSSYHLCSFVKKKNTLWWSDRTPLILTSAQLFLEAMVWTSVDATLGFYLLLKDIQV